MRRGSLWALVGVMFAVGGCGSLIKPYPEKSLHAISVGAPADAGQVGRGTAVVRVNSVRIARPYDGTTFVYKTGPTTFKTDYYAGFIASPDRLLGGETARWLDQSGLFASVIDGTSAAEFQFSLETNVTALYGDYSEKDRPAAVVEAKFFLIDEREGRYRIAFQKAYQAREPAAGASPGELSEAMGAAYRKVLVSLTADLSSERVVEIAPATSEALPAR